MTTPNLIELSMKYIRQDGSLDAPLIFLSTEDGHNGEAWTEKGLRDYLEQNPSWTPSPNQRHRPEDIGRIGNTISKIVTRIRDGSDQQWKDYRTHELYKQNECNLKLFPIARKEKADWGSLKQVLGIEQSLYQHYCDLARPQQLAMLLKNFDPRKQCFVILDEPTRWLNVLALVFKDQERPHLEVLSLDRWHFKSEFVLYSAPGAGLAGGFIQGHSRRMSGPVLADFAGYIRRFRPDLTERLLNAR